MIIQQADGSGRNDGTAARAARPPHDVAAPGACAGALRRLRTQAALSGAAAYRCCAGPAVHRGQRGCARRPLMPACVVLAGLLAAGLFSLLAFAPAEAAAVTATATSLPHAEGQPQRQQYPSHLETASLVPVSVGELEMFLYTDGTVHVSSSLAVDPLAPHVVVDLYGTAVDNFMAVGGSGLLLSADVAAGKATIHTLGADAVAIHYDIHDLVSKSGRMWKFEIESPAGFSLHMPSDAVLVGLDIIPDNMVIHEDHALTLGLDPGRTELVYITTGAPGTRLPAASHAAGDALDRSPPEPSFEPAGDMVPDAGVLPIAAAAAAAAAVAAILVNKRRPSKTATNETDGSMRYDADRSGGSPSGTGGVVVAVPAPTAVTHAPRTGTAPLRPPPNPERIFLSHPTLREDDKQIVRFIFDHGGTVMESDLRTAFLQPKTTMWRAVKRLERSGIVTTAKKDMQNQVILASDAQAGPQNAGGVQRQHAAGDRDRQADSMQGGEDGQ